MGLWYRKHLSCYYTTDKSNEFYDLLVLSQNGKFKDKEWFKMNKFALLVHHTSTTVPSLGWWPWVLQGSRLSKPLITTTPWSLHYIIPSRCCLLSSCLVSPQWWSIMSSTLSNSTCFWPWGFTSAKETLRQTQRGSIYASVLEITTPYW